MKLHEIIKAFESGTTAVELGQLLPYKKSLLTYYRREWPRNEPKLMVTSVSNAVRYGVVVPANDFHEALDVWIGASGTERDSEDWESDCEIINFNSFPLERL